MSSTKGSRKEKYITTSIDAEDERCFHQNKKAKVDCNSQERDDSSIPKTDINVKSDVIDNQMTQDTLKKKKEEFIAKGNLVLLPECLNNMTLEGDHLSLFEESSEMKKEKYRILVRDSYVSIYTDIVGMIFRVLCAKMTIGFAPQCCYLVYGNKSIGKTSFCYYLCYTFSHDKKFKQYDIVVMDDEVYSPQGRCYVRYGLDEEEDKNKSENMKEKSFSFEIRKDIPGRRSNHPIIIICDNLDIRRNDFYDSDIVISVASHQREKYESFYTKRAPIQYFIPQIKGAELERLLKFLDIDFISKEKAEEFGGNLYNAARYDSVKDMFIKKKDKMIEMPCYMPSNYNEDYLIYDTDECRNITSYLRYLSKEIEILFGYYDSPGQRINTKKQK